MKPIIIGLNNPYSDNAAHALAPHPERSAGWRLWRMAEDANPFFDRRAYLASFDRRNLLLARTIDRTRDAPAMRRAADQLKRGMSEGATVVLLGRSVVEAFSANLSSPLELVFIHPQVIDGVTWRLLPHPSGRSTFYNDPVIRMLAGMLLADIAKQEYP